MLRFIGSGIVFGVLAHDWSPFYGLSEICDLKIFKLIVADGNDDDPCDSVALTTTTSLASVSYISEAYY